MKKPAMGIGKRRKKWVAEISRNLGFIFIAAGAGDIIMGLRGEVVTIIVTLIGFALLILSVILIEEDE